MPNEFLGELKSAVIENNTINNDLYSEFDVKRGLRNQDGSGVLAGLSKISSVLGSEKSNGTLTPIEGKLKYRGIPIQSLADEPVTRFRRFEKAIYLLLVGQQAGADALDRFAQLVASKRQLSNQIVDHTIKAIPSKNVMNKLQTVVSALYTEDENPENIDPFENFVKSINIISKLPTIVAYAYLSAYKTNATYVLPPMDMSTSEAFLYMLREGRESSDLEKEILDLSLLLHAEHGGGNNSTFTTYVVTSSGTDVYAAITSAIGSLKGPLHGAANKKVMDMMSDIKAHVANWDDVSELREYLGKIIRKETYDRSGKLYGLGHAVYTKSDPRAEILKVKAEELAKEKDRMAEYNLYRLIEEEGPKVFQEVKGSDKVISPNVDFFSGFVYDCLDIPREVYTPLFAMARSAGWCAHRIEEILSGKRVIRPGYKFVG